MPALPGRAPTLRPVVFALGLYSAVAALLVACTAVALRRQGPAVEAVDDLVQIATAAAAAVMCARTARLSRGRTRQAWAAFAAGGAGWVAGATVWANDDLSGQRQVPLTDEPLLGLGR